VTTLRSERDLTGPFWAAADRGELVRPVCHDCGLSFFTPQVVCPFCQSPAWSYQPSLGTGRVYSHTTVHRPPDPSFEPPYVIADVEVVEGWRMMTWIVNCEPEQVSIDMAVRVCFVTGPVGEILPAFEPEVDQ
jgi:uncharacterized OB-fold protein